MAEPIVFYFDFISPYAYLAWHQLPAFTARHGRTLELRPILFAAALDHWGQLGPAEIPPKREFVFRQLLRRAAKLELQLVPPPAHPFNPLLALRIAGLPELSEDQRHDLVTRLFAATWGGGQGVADAAAVERALAGSAHDASALIAAASEAPAKRALIEAGQQALAAGVFGVPTMVVDGELFWGADSLPDIEDCLSGRDRLDPSLVERWRELPVGSARRKVSKDEGS